MTAKILVVDDEAHIAFLITQTLDELAEVGVTVLTAGDGAQALTLIRAERPDLVFLDIMLPKVNGYDVCSQVKADPALRAQVYIIMLTAKGQDFDKQRGEVVGADLYMTKPFDPDELLERTRLVLADKGYVLE